MSNMRMTFLEPVSPTYIYVNPASNKVHLMLPLAKGLEISTEKSLLIDFVPMDMNFRTQVLRELNDYKERIQFDIDVLSKLYAHETCFINDKTQRLLQIKGHIVALESITHAQFHDALEKMDRHCHSNLYSFQLRALRPTSSTVKNPVFSLNRANDEFNRPLSALYRQLHLKFATLNDRVRPSTLAAPNAAPSSAPVLTHNNILSRSLFNASARSPAAPANLQPLASAHEPFAAEPLDLPRPTLSSFAVALTSDQEKAEKLSICTQFLLAHFNIHCRAKQLSPLNFGAVLDKSELLSAELAEKIYNILVPGIPSDQSVTAAIAEFFNAHKLTFELARDLTAVDTSAILNKYWRNYNVVKDKNGHLLMDDFLVVDNCVRGIAATFHEHICVDFGSLLHVAQLTPMPQFEEAYMDMMVRPFIELAPSNNVGQANTIELSLRQVMDVVKDISIMEKLPIEMQNAYYVSDYPRLYSFLNAVARGNQAKVSEYLTLNPNYLLNDSVYFRDSAGRMFNCTAFEYAYWARDINMLVTLGRAMNTETKGAIYNQIQGRLSTGGWEYEQNENNYRSIHYSLDPLLLALKQHLILTKPRGFFESRPPLTTKGANLALEESWHNVGRAQRDLPIHVIQEYCDPRRDFRITPKFKKELLDRTDLLVTTGPYPFVAYDMISFTKLMENLDYRGAISRGSQPTAHEEIGYVSYYEVKYDYKAMKELDRTLSKLTEKAMSRLEIVPVQERPVEPELRFDF